MANTGQSAFSVADLFAEREARRHRDKAAEEQLQRKQQEELAQFKKRLDEFKVTPEIATSVLDRIRRAFERGETELMLSSFPSSFCSDSGRAIINAGAPPINKPTREEAAAAKDREPEWLGTLPAGGREVYEFWKANLKPGGFALTARILNYPGGMPGEVGLFFSWPKSAMDAGA